MQLASSVADAKAMIRKAFASAHFGTWSPARRGMNVSVWRDIVSQLRFEMGESDKKPVAYVREAVNPGAVQKQWRHGFLPMSADDYLDLLDCVGRQVVEGKAGAIDARLEPILERLGLVPSKLCEVLENFDRWMHGAVRTGRQLAAEAARTGRNWLHGLSHCRKAFADPG